MKWTPVVKFPQTSCLGYGGNHNSADCRFKTAICRHWGKRGHLSTVCRAALPVNHRPPEPNYKKTFKKPPRCRSDCFVVSHATATLPNNKIYLTVKLEGVPCKMEVDTGSSKSLIPWATIQQILPSISKQHLKPCQVRLKDYQGKAIPIMGCDDFHINHRNFSGCLPLIIVKGNLPSLLGLNWFTVFGLNILGIHAMVPDIYNSLSSEYADVFDNQLELWFKSEMAARPHNTTNWAEIEDGREWRRRINQLRRRFPSTANQCPEQAYPCPGEKHCPADQHAKLEEPKCSRHLTYLKNWVTQ
ncbi:uncharacterized protein LOC131191414 [Ahaetulla prasina]|uniref:uncharacterized protein LOC131191414 n=1 Tax=Ahaetulla prasina TaxID=499056 RepID=UPI0026497755|nr:uncharacterized protein LOC131191414 [Ahaetulla prasina]